MREADCDRYPSSNWPQLAYRGIAVKVILAIALNVFSFSTAGMLPAEVDIDQAKALVRASLTTKEQQLPRVEVEQYVDANSRQFLFFTVTWAGESKASVVVGNFAVDPQTADVFSATSSCLEETNAALHALQTRIRAGIHLSARDYRWLKTRGPLCER